jgi:hypothetical protein
MDITNSIDKDKRRRVWTTIKMKGRLRENRPIPWQLIILLICPFLQGSQAAGSKSAVKLLMDFAKKLAALF